jgi:hypothetical protein
MTAHIERSLVQGVVLNQRSDVMNRLSKLSILGALALLLSAPYAGAIAANSDVTPDQIAAASTPADHEAIAASYEQEAARLEALAKNHQSMAKAYEAAGATHKGLNVPAMAMHCKKLSEQYTAAARESRELAREHRAMKQ